MSKKQTKILRRKRRLKLLLPLLFLSSIAGGFLGGLHFADHAPDEAARITQMTSKTGNTFAARIRRWVDISAFQDWLNQPHGLPGVSAQQSNSSLQVFFVPAQKPGGSVAQDALIALIDSAHESVVCAFYDFELEQVAHALIARHQSGVKAAVVSDTDYKDRPGITLCRDAGISVVFDERSSLMHNKFCVVDGKHVWTGSTNITRNGMFENNNNAVSITSSKLAANFRSEFDEMFLQHKFGSRSPRNTPWPTLTVAGTQLECYFAPEDNVEQVVLARLEEARQQIAFMAFVFTSKPIAAMMIRQL
ncbi:MAG: hypothetical protein KAH38_10455, partial [Candidatus Hydrogenedentes bacterium]|nr:hypothetical protein [Candidatus Hydrogenedentota bacterium]